MNTSPIQVTLNLIIRMVSVMDSGENPRPVEVSSNRSPFSAGSWAREMEDVEQSKGNSEIFPYVRRNKGSPINSGGLRDTVNLGEMDYGSEKLSGESSGVNAPDLNVFLLRNSEVQQGLKGIEENSDNLVNSMGDIGFFIPENELKSPPTKPSTINEGTIALPRMFEPIKENLQPSTGFTTFVIINSVNSKSTTRCCTGPEGGKSKQILFKLCF